MVGETTGSGAAVGIRRAVDERVELRAEVAATVPGWARKLADDATRDMRGVFRRAGEFFQTMRETRRVGRDGIVGPTLLERKIVGGIGFRRQR